MGIIFRQSIKGTIVHYIGIVIGIITMLFIQPLVLSEEEIGLMKVLYESGLLICSLAMLGTTSSVIRFFPFFKNAKNKDNGFFFYMLILPAIGAVVFIPLVLLFKNIIIDFFSEKSALYVEYFNWVIPLILFLMYWTLFETYSNVKMRIAVPKLIREVGVRVLLLALYVAYGFNLLTLTQLVTCTISVYAVVMVITFIYIRKFNTITLKHDNKFIDKPLRNKILKYTGFLFLTAVSGNILAQLDIFMLASLKGLYFTGIYTIVMYIAAIIEMPSRSISAIAAPIAADALKNDDFEKANQLYKNVSLHQMITGSIIFLFVWINIDNIFAIIPNGETFSQGKWVVLFLGLSKIVAMTLNFGGILISYSRYYYWSLFFSVFISVSGIIANLLLIPKFGITGAALATLMTCLLSYSVQQWIVLKKVKGNPYTINTLKQIALILFLTGINYLLPNWSQNPFVDAAYRSIIMGILTIALLYKFKISLQINHVIDKSYEKIKKYI
ncbi:MAG: polysaccharide biosynthesis C-terminal domain-containing protein [Prevotellaceae bacterium]|jgi:O-antigen/teichoic acid export membrane protein|nr:polysaccharide biosynthesis C-terminal domain-containing protein [Prevotellaceae bacterium]